MKSCAVATLVVFALWLAGTARAQGSDWPAPLPAQASTQQATTEQGAMTAADATDAQPTNIFVSLRINSPGDNGPVTQTSTTAVAGDTANDAATAQDGWQDWASGAHAAPQASAQDSATTQAATTSATATRPRPTNVVVSVRVNSPGDDGPVTQSSTVAVAAQSKNTAATAQKVQQAGTAPTTAAAPPAPGAVADRPADPSAPASCVNVAPGMDATGIVITLGRSCHHHVAPKRAAAAAETHETPVRAAAPPAPAPPVVHAAPAPAVSAVPPPASSPPHASPKPRPAPVAPRPRVDPLAASTNVADLVAAVPVPKAGDTQYGVMLALLLAMLGAAAVWSYGGAYRSRFRYWRWR